MSPSSPFRIDRPRTTRSRLGRRFSALGALLLLGVGCAGPRLVPVAPERDGIATCSRSGIDIEADASVGPTPRNLPRAVTPIWVRFRNDTSSAVHLALQDVELVGGTRSLAATLPERIRPRPPVVGLGIDPLSPFSPAAAFDRSGTTAFPIRSSEAELSYVPEWRAAARSAGDIVRRALKNGWLEPGETRQGFVYFADVPTDVGALALRVQLRSADAGRELRTAEVRFRWKG